MTQHLISFKTCKHCGARVTLRTHPSCTPDNIPTQLLGNIVGWCSCNRCADHHAARNKVTDLIFKTCAAIYCARTTRTERTADREQSREALVALTKRLATIECDFYGVQNFWEKEFADLLFEKPDQSGKALSVYSSKIKAIGQPEQSHIEQYDEAELVEA